MLPSCFSRSLERAGPPQETTMDPHMNSSGARKRVTTNFPGNQSPDPEVGCERNWVVPQRLVRTLWLDHWCLQKSNQKAGQRPLSLGEPWERSRPAPCLCQSAGSTWPPVLSSIHTLMPSSKPCTPDDQELFTLKHHPVHVTHTERLPIGSEEGHDVSSLWLSGNSDKCVLFFY